MSEPKCSRCGVPISEHPLTDACAIADEATVGTLDHAWAAVEAALGDGRITSLEWPTERDDEWMASAYRPDGSGSQGFGPTPAAALLALAEKLAQR